MSARSRDKRKASKAKRSAAAAAETRRAEPQAFQSRVIKAEAINEQLGLVFGWGIICSKNGEPYYDLQNQHIPVDLMLKSVTDFMAHAAVTDEMHMEIEQGPVLHSMPITAETKKAFGIECEREGWIIAAKPSSAVLAKFVSGEYTGFSVGGFYSAVEAAA